MISVFIFKARVKLFPKMDTLGRFSKGEPALNGETGLFPMRWMSIQSENR